MACFGTSGFYNSKQSSYEHMNVKHAFKLGTIPLGAWGQKEIDLLESIGFEWSKAYEIRWKENFQKVDAYQRKHGNLHMPDLQRRDKRLHKWICGQQCFYNSGVFRKDRQKSVENIGLRWSDGGENWYRCRPSKRKRRRMDRHAGSDSSDTNADEDPDVDSHDKSHGDGDANGSYGSDSEANDEEPSDEDDERKVSASRPSSLDQDRSCSSQNGSSTAPYFVGRRVAVYSLTMTSFTRESF